MWETAAAAGIDETELDQVVARLRHHRVELDERVDSLEQRERARAALEQLLAGESLDALESELSAREQQLRADGDETPDEESVSELEARAAEAEAELAEARAKRDRLAGQVADRSSRGTEVAAAEEALAETDRERERLERLEAVLSRTRELLERARDQVQRSIAPRLRAAVHANLSRITGGRYQETLVSASDLRVQIRPRGGTWRDAGLHSHGTAEQVYLLLRIALAEHLVTNGEPAPLLLDDVTVQSDAVRTAAFLDLLHEESRKRQVVVFTQEEEVRSWARQRLGGPRDGTFELPLHDSTSSDTPPPADRDRQAGRPPSG